MRTVLLLFRFVLVFGATVDKIEGLIELVVFVWLRLGGNRAEIAAFLIFS